MHTGVDLGLKNTTIVTLDNDGRIIGVSSFGTDTELKFKKVSKNALVERYKLYYDSFIHHFKKYKVTGTVIMEDPAGSFQGFSIRLAELKGVYLVALSQVKNCHAIFPKASSIKKLFAGNGKADKNEMIQKCKVEGYLPSTEHEADATAMALLSIKDLIKGESTS